jgi:ATP-binding cassette subfamily B protein
LVFVDGKRIEEYDINFLRDNIGIVSQEPFIMNDTIMNNLIFDRDLGNKNEITECLKKASIFEDFFKLENGLNRVC